MKVGAGTATSAQLADSMMNKESNPARQKLWVLEQALESS
jgi:hypothetical protein